jgi:glucose/arabinose dehydrogenase
MAVTRPRVLFAGLLVLCSAAEAPAVQAAPLSGIVLSLTKRWNGFSQPLYLTAARGDSGRVFVVEKGGRIKVIRDGRVLRRPYLDISGKISKDGERGLLGLALAPNFRANGRFYINYTDLNGDTLIVRYRADRPLSDAPSFRSKVILKVPQPYANHNGGCLQFGPDGYLYIGMGDGGSAGDPQNRAQNPGTRLGKMLRIDVGEAPGATSVPATYRIPPTNPFVGRAGYQPEIFALGLRNPWRFSFDRSTGDLWIGDVGQGAREEIDFLPKGRSGANFGWNRFEGFATYPPGSPPQPNRSLFRPPVKDIAHPGAESITGGYVYRGNAYPVLKGTYVYGDFVTGKIWGLRRGATVANRLFRDTTLGISGFGEDSAGELYLCDLIGGAIYRITAR